MSKPGMGTALQKWRVSFPMPKIQVSPMSRPFNETEIDRRNEEEIVQQIAKGARYWKLPLSYGIDWMVELPNGLIFVEVKCRKEVSTRYKDVLISILKIKSAAALHQATGAPVFFCWAWSDCMTVAKWDHKPARIEMAGRRDRGQEGDLEPCAFFTIDELKKVKYETVA